VRQQGFDLIHINARTGLGFHEVARKHANIAQNGLTPMGLSRERDSAAKMLTHFSKEIRRSFQNMLIY